MKIIYFIYFSKILEKINFSNFLLSQEFSPKTSISSMKNDHVAILMLIILENIVIKIVVRIFVDNLFNPPKNLEMKKGNNIS